MSTTIASESEKTKKAREKLKRRLERIDQKVTDQALKRKLHEMKIWISKYALDRVVIKDPQTAPITKKTARIYEQMKKQFVNES